MSDVLHILSLTYPLLFLIAGIIVLSISRKRQLHSLAAQILRQQKAAWGTQHEFRHVSPAEFRDLDLAFYDRTQAFFESGGFRCLADLENLTLAATFRWSHAFTRVLLNADGTIWVTIHDVGVRGWMAIMRRLNKGPRDFRTVAVATAFSDGTYLATSNSLGTDNTSAPAAIRRYQYPQATPLEELLQYHRWALDEVLKYDANAYAFPHANLDDLLATWRQMQAVRNEHFKSIGYMNQEELNRLAGRSNRQVLRDVGRELESLKAEEQQGSQDLRA